MGNTKFNGKSAIDILFAIQLILWSVKNRGIEKTLEDLNKLDLSTHLYYSCPDEEIYNGLIKILTETTKLVMWEKEENIPHE